MGKEADEANRAQGDQSQRCGPPAGNSHGSSHNRQSADADGNGKREPVASVSEAQFPGPSQTWKQQTGHSHDAEPQSADLTRCCQGNDRAHHNHCKSECALVRQLMHQALQTQSVLTSNPIPAHRKETIPTVFCITLFQLFMSVVGAGFLIARLLRSGNDVPGARETGMRSPKPSV